MRGNYWGKAFGITTFGESHGRAIGVVIEDVKPNRDFPIGEIQNALDARRPGQGKFSSQRNEKDRIEVISGVFEGKTTGMPICLLVYNEDVREGDYEALKELFRPEHADLSYFKKFKIIDYRGGGRASGRETIARVAAGELVNEVIGEIKITIYPVSIGTVQAKKIDEDYIKTNSLYWGCQESYQTVVDYLNEIKEGLDSVGGIVEVRIDNVPAGLGDPVFEKLEANLAKAILSIGGVKGIEFGRGFQLARLRGSEANQPLTTLNPTDETTNSGGIYGGITTGEPLLFRFAVKPTPSIGVPQETINREGGKRTLSMKGRFDTCLVSRIIPVANAMIKLVLADAISYQSLLNDEEDSLERWREGIDKIDEDILISLYRRKNLVDKIKELKQKKGLANYQPQREKELLASLTKKGESLGIESNLIEALWKVIFEHNRGRQL